MYIGDIKVQYHIHEMAISVRA